MMCKDAAPLDIGPAHSAVNVAVWGRVYSIIPDHKLCQIAGYAYQVQPPTASGPYYPPSHSHQTLIQKISD